MTFEVARRLKPPAVSSSLPSPSPTPTHAPPVSSESTEQGSRVAEQDSRVRREEKREGEGEERRAEAETYGPRRTAGRSPAPGGSGGSSPRANTPGRSEGARKAPSSVRRRVGLRGLEPRASSLSGTRSNRLSYNPIDLQKQEQELSYRTRGAGCAVTLRQRAHSVSRRVTSTPPISREVRL